jgi:hypothetical protein
MKSLKSEVRSKKYAKRSLIRDAVVLTRSAGLQACPGTPLAALKGCATSGGPANTKCLAGLVNR